MDALLEVHVLHLSVLVSNDLREAYESFYSVMAHYMQRKRINWKVYYKLVMDLGEIALKLTENPALTNLLIEVIKGDASRRRIGLVDFTKFSKISDWWRRWYLNWRIREKAFHCLLKLYIHADENIKREI